MQLQQQRQRLGRELGDVVLQPIKQPTCGGQALSVAGNWGLAPGSAPLLGKAPHQPPRFRVSRDSASDIAARPAGSKFPWAQPCLLTLQTTRGRLFRQPVSAILALACRQRS
jgi:hypothetical protein